MPEYKKYRESLSDELLAIKDRVRNLINDSNWAEEGRYKEVILMEILKSVLPSNVLLGTGFVVSDNDVKSTQIDIIIYKNNYPESPVQPYSAGKTTSRQSRLYPCNTVLSSNSRIF